MTRLEAERVLQPIPDRRCVLLRKARNREGGYENKKKHCGVDQGPYQLMRNGKLAKPANCIL
jgi:hypothetical protein